MSMASEEQPHELQLARRRDESTQALGVIAAVSAAGLLVSRMKAGPLLFLAGAAAAGWLAKRRRIQSQPSLAILPERMPEEPVQPPPVISNPQIDAWLASQAAREKEAPVITLDFLGEATVPRPVENSAVLSANLPDLPEIEPTPSFPADPAPTAFTPLFQEAPPPEPEPETVPLYGLSEPPPPPEASPFFAGSSWNEDAPVFGRKPSAPPVGLPLFQFTSPAPAADSTWLLGIEPMPSWDESASASEPAQNTSPWMQESQVPSFETVSREASALPEVEPPFVPSLFQGGSLPDEICVPAPVDESVTPPEPFPAASLLDTPLSAPQVSIAPPDHPRPVFVAHKRAVPVEKPIAPPAEMSVPVPEPFAPFHAVNRDLETLPELPVTLAKPGEASFDDPLSALDIHGSPGSSEQPEPPLRPMSQVVEAEIIVRPRGLRGASVIAKTPTSPLGQPHAAPPSPGAPGMMSLPPDLPADSPIPGLPPAPVVVPREQRARKTWRSWWRGE